MERAGLLSWKQKSGRRRELKIWGSVITRCLAIIWKWRIRSKIWCPITMWENRRWPTRNVISSRSWKNWKTRFWELRTGFVHWNMNCTVKCGTKSPEKSFASRRLQKRLPSWMWLPPLPWLRREIIMSARKLTRKVSLISKTDVTRWWRKWSLMICLSAMIPIWMIKRTAFRLSPDRIWPVNRRTCVRLHWSYWWHRSVHLSRHRPRISDL